MEPLVGVIAFRPEASLLYINAETILETVLKVAAERRTSGWSSAIFRHRPSSIWRAHGCCSISMTNWRRAIAFQIVGARGQLRDVLRAEGLAEKTDSTEWTRRIDSVLGELKAG